MKFRSDLSQDILKGTLVYMPSESSIDFILKDKSSIYPLTEEGITSLLINKVQLEINMDGRLLYVWGLITYYTRWQKTVLSLPATQTGAIFAKSEKRLTPGISVQISGDQMWTVYADVDKGLLRIGEPTEAVSSISIEFAENCIATIHDGSIEAIWLRMPEVTQALQKFEKIKP